MAKSIQKPAESTATTNDKYSQRRWVKPKLRAQSYAEERKAKKHNHGPKKDKELTDYEAGIRSGYLQCQTDHAGLYKPMAGHSAFLYRLSWKCRGDCHVVGLCPTPRNDNFFRSCKNGDEQCSSPFDIIYS